jgi:hypothetical protein
MEIVNWQNAAEKKVMKLAIRADLMEVAQLYEGVISNPNIEKWRSNRRKNIRNY